MRTQFIFFLLENLCMIVWGALDDEHIFSFADSRNVRVRRTSLPVTSGRAKASVADLGDIVGDAVPRQERSNQATVPSVLSPPVKITYHGQKFLWQPSSSGRLYRKVDGHLVTQYAGSHSHRHNRPHHSKRRGHRYQVKHPKDYTLFYQTQKGSDLKYKTRPFKSGESKKPSSWTWNSSDSDEWQEQHAEESSKSKIISTSINGRSEGGSNSHDQQNIHSFLAEQVQETVDSLEIKGLKKGTVSAEEEKLDSEQSPPTNDEIQPPLDEGVIPESNEDDDPDGC